MLRVGGGRRGRCARWGGSQCVAAGLLPPTQQTHLEGDSFIPFRRNDTARPKLAQVPKRT